ncbi:MAG: type 2 isopentenyl-diphosphate Delta-isomerase, partial [Nanoarchaeota archaeon]|nr:type 2 isopentenyl-diphosphate Delta-isomerase [Nanoarchaeota archaeon]
MPDILKNRKAEHIKICLEKPVEFEKSNGFERYEFEHKALPEIDRDDIDVSTSFLGKKFSSPIYIEGMTGGTSEAKLINKNLAKAAQELSIGMGVGSQRAAIKHPEVEGTYNVRDVAPDIFLLGNLGGAQLAEYGVDKVRHAVDMIKANGLAIHLNIGQEAFQPEGETKWGDVLQKIKDICSQVDFPIVVKEIGNGLVGSEQKKLQDAGVAAIDVAGAGGTNWIKVEYHRGAKNAEPFFEWGTKTAECLRQAKENVTVPIIASGGMRTGLDVA